MCIRDRSVIGDLYKTNVFKLCNWLDSEDSIERRKAYKLNTKSKIIGDQICNKAPSAELGPDQLDTDSLPPYSLLDKILKGIIEEKKDLQLLEQDGHCLLYTSPSPRDLSTSRMPSSA